MPDSGQTVRHVVRAGLQIKVERMAQESRVQKAVQEQEKQFGRITRSISGTSLYQPFEVWEASGALQNLLGLECVLIKWQRQHSARTDGRESSNIGYLACVQWSMYSLRRCS